MPSVQTPTTKFTLERHAPNSNLLYISFVNPVLESKVYKFTDVELVEMMRIFEKHHRTYIKKEKVA